MKLLQRFIWLIVGILFLVFVTITIYQARTENEFNTIKQSIKQEYDVQVDKMLAIDPHSVGEFSSYMSELTNTPLTKTFVTRSEYQHFTRLSFQRNINLSQRRCNLVLQAGRRTIPF
jgi:hypothetical protein